MNNKPKLDQIFEALIGLEASVSQIKNHLGLDVDLPTTSEQIAGSTSPQILTEETLKSNYNVGWIGDNFKEHFLGMEFEHTPSEFEVTKLKKSMSEDQITKEIKPKEVTLGQLLWFLDNAEKVTPDAKDGYINLFRMRDRDGALWAVFADFDAGGGYWYADADSVGGPDEWRAGGRVVSGK